MTNGSLFRDCRQVLGLSVKEMAKRLCVGSGRTLRRWEADVCEIPGPVWACLSYMLREQANIYAPEPALLKEAVADLMLEHVDEIKLRYIKR